VGVGWGAWLGEGEAVGAGVGLADGAGVGDAVGLPTGADGSGDADSATADPHMTISPAAPTAPATS
jgi:hypothetical protein